MALKDQMVWIVEGDAPAKPDRLLVTTCDGTNAQPKLTISVRRDAVAPLAMHQALPVHMPDNDWLAVRQSVEAVMHEFTMAPAPSRSLPTLNQWLPLAGLGGNSLMLRKATDPNSCALVLFLEIHGYELWFHSTWANDSILMLDFDMIKKCPAQQFWPWCSWCGKFLLPVESHRCSSKHSAAMQHLHTNGLDWCRKEILKRL